LDTIVRLGDDGTAGNGKARTNVLGCPIDLVDMQAAVERCDELIRSGGYGQHMAVNAAKLVTMQHDQTMREIIEGCHVVTADGQPLVWVSRLLADPIPERVTGIDLMLALLALAEERGYGVYILGAQPEVLECAIGKLTERHPRLRIVGHHDGYFPPEEDAAVAADIRAARPDMLFVAMTSPRKEYFLGHVGPDLGVPFAMGVGGSIDVVAGKTRRAPRWMQRSGLEWLYRLLQEPRRLLRRYATTNARFVALVAREWARRRLLRASA
jgi:N-acetylglucosaminyldiphosphoundecaprenol N-acetyl-beta-D-mannosaminyltransferase